MVQGFCTDGGRQCPRKGTGGEGMMAQFLAVIRNIKEIQLKWRTRGGKDLVFVRRIPLNFPVIEMAPRVREKRLVAGD